MTAEPKKRGRPKGSKGAGMRDGSTAHWLSSFDVGERRYTETTLATYERDMRQLNMPSTRRPDILKDRVFQCRLFTSIAAADVSDIRYIIATERLS